MKKRNTYIAFILCLLTPFLTSYTTSKEAIDIDIDVKRRFNNIKATIQKYANQLNFPLSANRKTTLYGRIEKNCIDAYNTKTNNAQQESSKKDIVNTCNAFYQTTFDTNINDFRTNYDAVTAQYKTYIKDIHSSFSIYNSAVKVTRGTLLKDDISILQEKYKKFKKNYKLENPFVEQHREALNNSYFKKALADLETKKQTVIYNITYHNRVDWIKNMGYYIGTPAAVTMLFIIAKVHDNQINTLKGY